MKYGSRKFIFSIVQLIILVGVPILFHQLGISDDTTKVVLACTFGGHLYHFSNLMERKLSGPTD